MAIDTNLQLFSNTAYNGATNATSTNGSDLNIGRTGLNRNAQLVAFVQLASAVRDLDMTLYLGLNNSTMRSIGSIHFAKGYRGKQVLHIGNEFPWEQWTDGEIELRLNVAHSNAENGDDSNHGRVSAYIGYGERQAYGRKPGAAETLVDA